MYRCQKGLSSEKPGFSSENPVPWVATTRWASASTIPPRMVEPAPPGPSPGAGPAGAGDWGPRAGRPRRHGSAGFHRRFGARSGAAGNGSSAPRPRRPGPGRARGEAPHQTSEGRRGRDVRAFTENGVPDHRESLPRGGLNSIVGSSSRSCDSLSHVVGCLRSRLLFVVCCQRLRRWASVVRVVVRFLVKRDGVWEGPVVRVMWMRRTAEGIVVGAPAASK